MCYVSDAIIIIVYIIAGVKNKKKGVIIMKIIKLLFFKSYLFFLNRFNNQFDQLSIDHSTEKRQYVINVGLISGEVVPYKRFRYKKTTKNQK